LRVQQQKPFPGKAGLKTKKDKLLGQIFLS